MPLKLPTKPTLSANEILMIYTGAQLAPMPFYGATGKRYLVSRNKPFAANEADVSYLISLGCFGYA